MAPYIRPEPINATAKNCLEKWKNQRPEFAGGNSQKESRMGPLALPNENSLGLSLDSTNETRSKSEAS